MANNVFRSVGALRPGRSVMDLTHDFKFTCDMGQLIPVMCEELSPGDTFKVSNEIVIRFMPLVAPILHEINVYVHYFFVPHRLVWDDWEKFITGGVDGDFEAEIPQWTDATDLNVTEVGTLWDYFGHPTRVNPVGYYPTCLHRRGYNLIYNEYYRDQNLQDPVDLDQNFVLNRCWEKDYFTTALPWQQRGTAPALPISGGVSFDGIMGVAPPGALVQAGRLMFSSNSGNPALNQYTDSGSPQATTQDMIDWFNNNHFDAQTFDVSDLRLAFQIQKWLERNARAGSRYTEFLRSHFGVAPRDERLQRPEYVGGSKSPVIISEVLQTSGTDKPGEGNQATPQGNLAGHAITADRNFVAKYTAVEYGYLFGIMSVMPRATYAQGIDRMFLRRTKYDFYFPEFANLSEQAIQQVEIMAANNLTENSRIFGYQGRYDELRSRRSRVGGLMRYIANGFAHWHLGRFFTFDNPPRLNEQFVECRPSKRIFAVPTQPGLVVSIGNIIRAIRPMPVASNPGLIDHH